MILKTIKLELMSKLTNKKLNWQLSPAQKGWEITANN
jgi:hypothetical protein